MSERILLSDRHYPRLAQPEPPEPPAKKTEWIVPVALGSVAAVFVLIVAVGAAVGTNSAAGRAGAAVAKAAAKGGRSALNAGTVTAGQTAPAGQAPTSAVPPSPSAQSVTFSCTGKAPDGIEITYGPDGSSLGASALPFSRTLPLDLNAMYYVVQAQLQGSGAVSCSTVVDYNDASGMARSVTKTGAATRGFNIADAQVCSGFDVDWETC
jgi:hypothetical protein